MILSGMGQPPLFTAELSDLARGGGLGLPEYFTPDQMITVEDFVLAQVKQVLSDAPLIGGPSLGGLRKAIDALEDDRSAWAKRRPSAWFGTPLPTGKAGKDGTLYKASVKLMQNAYAEAAGVAGGTQTESAARGDLTQNLTHPLTNAELPLGNLWAKYKTPVKLAAASALALILFPYVKPVIARAKLLRAP